MTIMVVRCYRVGKEYNKISWMNRADFHVGVFWAG